MLDCGADVERAVIDEDVDFQLDAAGDLVKGATEIVERNPKAFQPPSGCGSASARAVARDMDEVPLFAPRPDRLDRARVWTTGENQLVAMALLDAQRKLVGAQTSDAPRELLLIGQLDAKATA